MTSPPEMTVVGTYPSQEEAQRARSYLYTSGIEPVELEQLSSASWQVEAPAHRREQALQALQRMEEQTIVDYW